MAVVATKVVLAWIVMGGNAVPTATAPARRVVGYVIVPPKRAG
ncbi:Uncharacterised protein (plasmid) [Tsukamurella tyrosinosolvens]|nr:Uncharacterised protein [Tsukamurella tyrosinosolvens]